jgi:hypothetical protein
MLSFYLSFIQLWALLECTWLKCYYYLPIVLITVVVIDRHTEIKVNDRPPLVFFYIYLFFSLSHCIPDLRALLHYSVGNTTPVVGEWEY